MNGRSPWKDRLILGCGLVAAVPVFAQSGNASGSAAKVGVSVESLMDRRTSGDFPSPGLTVSLTLEGDDARSVASTRPRVIRAVDDTGRNLAAESARQGSDGWQPARVGSPPLVRLELASPSRKAKSLTSLEGVVETYMPSRDPAATVRVERVLAKKDKPLPMPALEKQGVKLRILSKAGLEKEKKQAEAGKKAEAAKKKGKKGETEGLEGMAEAMAGAFGEMLERLLFSAGENDLIVRVDDPGKKVFSFDLAAADGSPIQSYGTMEVQNYRIVRMFEPIPQGASLLVRLRTERSFAEVPFHLVNVKLP